MTHPFVDTDVLIRLLTVDDLEKQAAAATLFEAVEAGELTVAAPYTVIADAVYVLSSPRVYYKSRAEVAAMLIPLVRLSGF
jgi:predicted nucleic acid-binding protein